MDTIQSASGANPAGTLLYMIHSRTPLKALRGESPLDQKDVAQLLDLKASNLVRYEKGHRNPTPELLLVYHMLFDASLKDLFAPIHRHMVDTLVLRIKKLIADLNSQQSSKSNYKVTYLQGIVNRLTTNQP